MSSTYGAKRGFPAFDKFKTGLSYQDAFNMLWVDSDNPDDWKRKSTGMVLRLLHKLKVEMFESATGINVDRDLPSEGDTEEVARQVTYQLAPEILSLYLRDEDQPHYGHTGVNDVNIKLATLFQWTQYAQPVKVNRVKKTRPESPRMIELRKGLIEEAELAGLTPGRLARELAREIQEKTISFRPSRRLREALDEEARKRKTTVGRVCKAWLESQFTTKEAPQQEPCHGSDEHL